MQKISLLTPNEIANLSYTDFVGLINQWNVPPGALSTINKWKTFSNLDCHSNILEIACTTGFSSRELALLSNCSGVGIDVSHASIDAANKNKKNYAPDIKIEYKHFDAYLYKDNIKFTHIILGAALKFFPDPQRLLTHIMSMIEHEGVFLASPFYIQAPIPTDLINRFKAVFGIKPTTEGYKDVMQVYKGLEIIYQDQMEIHQETDSELKHYCESTISRQLKEESIDKEEIFNICYHRLLEIKTMSNLLRPYQKFTTLVLRYRENIYPQRYIELF